LSPSSLRLGLSFQLISASFLLLLSVSKEGKRFVCYLSIIAPFFLLCFVLLVPAAAREVRSFLLNFILFRGAFFHVKYFFDLLPFIYIWLDGRIFTSVHFYNIRTSLFSRMDLQKNSVRSLSFIYLITFFFDICHIRAHS